MRKLLLATNNAGKVREYRALLQGLPYELVTPADLGITEEARETGNSLEENARVKAEFYGRRSGLLTLADDSGLEVDALGGRPGPVSARYAGEGASDGDRIEFLLAQLKEVPPEKRSARFRCVIVLAVPGGEILFFQGERAGVITSAPRGDRGFGYDPVFLIPELNMTMAELPPEVKNRVSHRAQAARKAIERLKRWGREEGNL